MKRDVFISYSRQDMIVVDKIATALEQIGVSFFTDRSCIPVGADYIDCLEEAILECRIFLFLASKNSYKSQWSWNELNFFLKERDIEHFLILIIDNSIIPTQIKKETKSAKVINITNYLTKFDVYSNLAENIKNFIQSTSVPKILEKKQLSFKTMQTEEFVFISHSHQDQTISEKLYDYLTTNGVKCWMDTYDIHPGKPYAKAIVDAIIKCTTFVILFSKNALESDDILNEIDQAHFSRKRIIPFLLDGSEMTNEFRYYLSRRQWIIAYPNTDHHFEDLIKFLSC